MKLVHGEASAPRKSPKAPLPALSAFLLSSCAAFHMQPAHPGPEPAGVSAHADSLPAPAGSRAPPASDERRSLPSSWERGRCVFENGRDISYSDDLGSRQRSLRVDSDAHEARSVLCSGAFTVLMLPDRAIVSLGGDGILEGVEMLGQISGRFIPANSYEVSLRPIISEDGGVSSSTLSGTVLGVASKAGRRWSIDISDPYAGWNVY